MVSPPTFSAPESVSANEKNERLDFAIWSIFGQLAAFMKPPEYRAKPPPVP